MKKSWLKFLILIPLVLVLIMIIAISNNNKAKKEKELHDSLVAQDNAMLETVVETSSLSQEEQEQLAFINQWGTPPDGFKWNNRGELEAISSDSMNSEEVLWAYLRALSILDFSTVEKYSSNSIVSSTYSSYFSDSSIGNASYYKQFLRKAYKFALTSIEVEGVSNIAVFPDGSNIATVKLNVLDLTDKDFWEADSEQIYSKLRDYNETESDSTKAEQYIYDYIYSAYESNKIGKRTITVEIKLNKITNGGWLVSDDTDLDMALRYDNGVNVADYIQSCYIEWYKNKLNEEASIENELQRQKASEEVSD